MDEKELRIQNHMRRVQRELKALEPKSKEPTVRVVSARIVRLTRALLEDGPLTIDQLITRLGVSPKTALAAVNTPGIIKTGRGIRSDPFRYSL